MERTCVSAALLLLLAAQGLRPESQESEPAVLRVTTHVVEVSVIATPKNGQMDRELTAADLRLWDNGKEQVIRSFEKLSSVTTPADNLEPGVFSNRFSARPQIFSIILLDALNTSWANTASARAEVLRAITQIRPGERIAIFVLGDGLRVVHDFSSDSASLLRKLNSAAGIGPLGRASGTPRRLSAAFSSEMRHRQMEGGPARNFFQTGRILDTFAALEAIANHVKGLPGRKNLLWVSAAFPLGIGNRGQLRTFGDEMERAARALNSADIAVYPIDARGLFVGNPYVNVSTMKALAEETGGTAFYNRNDLHQAVRAALDDTRDVYSLSYSPQDFSEDGSFHRIRIETSRRDIQLRYRRGYYASQAVSEEKLPAVTTIMDSAFGSPLDASEIGLAARVERRATDGKDLSVLIQVDPRDLNLRRQGDRWTGAISVGLVQLGAAGERRGEAVKEMGISISPEDYDRVMKGNFAFRMRMRREEGASSLRVAVVDKASAHVGSLSVPFPDTL